MSFPQFYSRLITQCVYIELLADKLQKTISYLNFADKADLSFLLKSVFPTDQRIFFLYVVYTLPFTP